MIIFFTKEFFFFWFIHFYYNLEYDNKSVFLIFDDQSKAWSGLFPNELIEWQRTSMWHFYNFFSNLLGYSVKTFSLCEAFFLVWSYFFDPFNWRNSPLFIGEVRKLNLGSLKYGCWIQRIWFLDFSNFSPLWKKFVNTRILIFIYFF